MIVPWATGLIECGIGSPLRTNVHQLSSFGTNTIMKSITQRTVGNHLLLRISLSAGLLIEEGATSAYTDLTQELFVQLLTKSRFQHYLDTAMTDGEIECEIGQIELTNLLDAAEASCGSDNCGSPARHADGWLHRRRADVNQQFGL
jgi:hypothetical protein